AAVLAIVKGKSLRDGLRPPLTAAARSGQRKLGWDEEMVAVRSNKEMVKNSSLDTNRPIQVTDWAIENVVSSLHCMNDPQAGGHMASHIGRRKFLATLGCAAAAWPLAARAQQPDGMRRIGMLLALAEDDPEIRARLAAFRQGLEKRGWSEGRNVHID